MKNFLTTFALMKKTLAAFALFLILATPVSAKTLRMADSTDIAAMDPHSMTESNTIGFLNHVYEGLVKYTDELVVEPALATSWEFVEPTRIRFHLRKGVKFHNGNPFTADDVVASLLRASDDSSPVKSNIPGMASVKKIDDFTVELILSGTDPIVLNYLTNIYIMDNEWMVEHDALLPADIRKGKENFAVANSNGTGPFMLESRQPDARTVLVVNPDWWDTPKHNLTRIEFNPIASDATRIAALLSGELDFITPAPLQDINRINSADGVSVLEGPELRTIMLGMNYGEALHNSNVTDKNPLRDLRVRQALNTAINMDLIHEKVMRGKSRNSALLVAPPVPGYSAKADVRVKADAALAKQLLAEAGYPDGFNTRLDYDVRADTSYAELIANYWREIGVEVKIHTVDATQNTVFWQKNTSDGMIGGTTAMTYSAAGLENWTTGGKWNGSAGSDSELDELWGRAEFAATIEEQNRAFKRMNMRLSELHWVVTGPVSPQFNVAQPWIKGYNGEVAISINGQYSTVLTRVWVDQDLKREMGF